MTRAMDRAFLGARADRVRERLAEEEAARRLEADRWIAGSLEAAAATLMRERPGATDPDGARSAIEAAAARLAASARLYRRLCQTGMREEIALGAFLDSLREDMEAARGARLDIRAGGVRVPADTAARIGTVVSEMAAISVRHRDASRPGRIPLPAPVLTVEADANGWGEVRLRLYDDGSDRSEGFDPKADGGIGMSIVSAVVERLGGDIHAMPRFGAYLRAGAGLEIVLPSARPRAGRAGARP